MDRYGLRFLDLCVKEASRSRTGNLTAKSKYKSHLTNYPTELMSEDRVKMLQKKNANTSKAEIRSKYTFTGESSDKRGEVAPKSRSGPQKGGIRGMEI
jgi:hypothetical protein